MIGSECALGRELSKALLPDSSRPLAVNTNSHTLPIRYLQLAPDRPHVELSFQLTLGCKRAEVRILDARLCRT